MSLLSDVRERLRALLFRSANEREMEEEIRFHLDREADRLMRDEGCPPDEARRRASLSFGGVERVKEEVRDARGVRWLEDFAADVRYALRQFTRSPGFTAVAVLTIALGIGANSAIFSAVNAVLLRPLEYRAPDRLVFVYSEVPAWGPQQFGLSPSEYRELQELARSFSALGAWRIGSVNLSGIDRPVRVTAATVTPELFATLGVSPRLGRPFTAEEDAAGEQVIVISSGLWRGVFGSDPTIIGAEIAVDGKSSVIAGVMPEGFDVGESGVDVWTPAGLPENPSTRASHFLSVVGRLAPGVALEEAKRELDGLLARWGELRPSWHMPNDSTHRLGFQDLHDHTIGDVRPALLILLGAVGLLLLIACANVANLLVGRAESRHREMAVRAAIGAGRRRLVRQLLTESTVLAAVGGAAGLLLGHWGLRVLIGVSSESVPRADSIGIDLPVLLFTLGVTALTGILFGLAPLPYLRNAAMGNALKGGGQRSTATAGRQRLRRILVAAQVALAVVLVIGSGLLLRSLHSLLAVEPGFDAQDVLTFELSLPDARYPEGLDRAAFLERLVRRLEAIPAVNGAAAMSGLPPVQDANESEMELEGNREVPEGPHHSVDYLQMVTGRYFETMGIRIVAGRSFRESDDARATPVAIVNETFARRFYPDEDPLGQRVRLAWATASWLTIVGVVEDVKQGGPAQETGAELYFHYPQAATVAFAPRNMHVVMRSSGPPPLSLAPAVRRAVHALDPSLPVAGLQTLEATLARSLNRPRFLALLLSIFAGVGLTLAAVGTYGVLSYSVATRRKEIGVRMALGAEARGVLGMVLRDGLSVIGMGLVLGILGALALTRLLSSLLFGIGTTDPLTYVAAVGLLAVVALTACWIPAHRATRVDPMIALRSD